MSRARPSDQALVASPSSQQAVSTEGFDPSRSGERVRVILDCEWGDLQHALDMVIEARPAFDRIPSRPGWGWNYSRRERPTLFVRRTKHGYSATAAASAIEARSDATGTGAAEGESAVGKAETPTPKSGDQ